jgi:hypothetical protein
MLLTRKQNLCRSGSPPVRPERSVSEGKERTTGGVRCKNQCAFGLNTASPVTLSPSLVVMLSGAKHLSLPLRINSAKGLFSLRDSSAFRLRMTVLAVRLDSDLLCHVRQIEYRFLHV